MIADRIGLVGCGMAGLEWIQYSALSEKMIL